MHVTYNFFKGSIPRLAPHLIEPGHANRAIDCKLTNGRLESWREPKKIRDAKSDTQRTFRFDCCWLDFEECVDIAQGFPTCQQLFITGWKDYPVALSQNDDDCSHTERRLGLPCPQTAPSIVPGSTANVADRDREGRSYAYQYVNSDSVRGALSPGTLTQNLYDGQPVVVSGWPIPSPEWGITHVRIYRTVSGDTSGTEKGHKQDTTWMFVDEVDVNATSFTDNYHNEELFQALEEDEAYPPPAGLRGITWIKSMNTLAGFVGNRIYFSKNNNYDHWPHWMDLDDNICGIVESNNQIYVATDGHPYIIEGAVDCEHAGCRKSVRLPAAMPMVGCGNRHIAATNSGAVYASHRGLVLLAGKSQPAYLTWPIYSPEDWQQLHPSTVIPVQYDGKLFVFARNGSFVMSLAEGPEIGWDADNHSELSDTNVTDAFVTRQGELMLLKDDVVYQWDRGTVLREHLWESNEHVQPRPVGLGAGHLFFRHGPEHVKIEVDRKVALDRDVLSERVFRLPMWASGTRWRFTLTGTGQVSLLSVAPVMQELG